MADREHLLDGADRAVRRLGHAASMSDIAAEAGITKPILYRHFGDRDGLVRALAERHTERLLPALRAALATRGPVRPRLVATTRAYLAMIDSDPEIYRFLTSGEGARADSPVTTFTRRFTAEVAEGLRQVPGFPPQDPRPALWAAALVATVRAAGDAWLDGAEPRDAGAVAELLAELVDGALTTARARPAPV